MVTQAGARPAPWAKCLFFLLTVLYMGLPCLVLMSEVDDLSLAIQGYRDGVRG